MRRTYAFATILFILGIIVLPPFLSARAVYLIPGHPEAENAPQSAAEAGNGVSEPPVNPVYQTAVTLFKQDGHHPLWSRARLLPGASTTPALADAIIPYLIACESGTESDPKIVDGIDSNGLVSRGILQFQDPTWEDWSRASGMTGSPDNINDSITMAEWAIEHGLLDHWTCSFLTGVIH